MQINDLCLETFVQLMQAFTAIYGVFISISGVMIVNAVDALSTKLQEIWEIHIDAEKSDYTLVPFDDTKLNIDSTISSLKNNWRRILILGIVGIIISLASIITELTFPVISIVIWFNYIFFLLQILVFIDSSNKALNALSSWVMKPPKKR